ncbi:hypothetical protein BHM03_00031083 [Ensete ventricosum]|nr:hypothetical protein BHM03_00031083 [Ensete ventricosum]
MAPVGGGGGGIGCGVAGCEADVTACCPAEFEVRRGRRVVGCKSACLALKADGYCCIGRYGSPTSCHPTRLSHLFKSICPRAYSYAFDDPSSLKKCRASRYLITFCLKSAVWPCKFDSVSPTARGLLFRVSPYMRQ